jgi:hypothetical protein
MSSSRMNDVSEASRSPAQTSCASNHPIASERVLKCLCGTPFKTQICSADLRVLIYPFTPPKELASAVSDEGVLRVYGHQTPNPGQAEDRDREFSEGALPTFHLVTASPAACACSTEGCSTTHRPDLRGETLHASLYQRCRLHQGLRHHDDSGREPHSAKETCWSGR